ncbi:PF04365 family protein [Leptospira inadai serovar Lyme str. 10]|uniref:PF04365 family protein n=1 Tax=Leptospira inadai serovar Lyme str. 10 TaxID=1049790 RepID=V6HIA7_9LEPT|nr:PF04365 family protein [Leptospira inadai serovar Lyme str. 10]
MINDPEHSEDEERFVILGFSYKLNLLMVSHCYRSSKDIIRIISARKATKSESKQYEAFL